jgi:hypothetical protein
MNTMNSEQRNKARNLVNKGQFAESIVASDSKDLVVKNARLYVGTRGDLKVDVVGGATIVLKNVANGTFIDWLQVSKVWSMGTTALDIVAIY